MKRMCAVVFALVVCVALLVGCGGQGASGSGSATVNQNASAAANSAGGTSSGAAASSVGAPAVEETYYLVEEAYVVNGTLKKTTIHEYDEANHEVRCTVNGKVTHEWTYNGDLLIEEIDYSTSDGRRYVYTYSDGKLVHKDTYRVGNGGVLFRSEDYELDSQGRVLVEHWYNAKGKHTGDVTYAYNADGSYTETHPYADAPEETYTIVYDAHGRVLDNGQGAVYQYGNDAYIRTVTDPSGNKVVITSERTYDAEGNLAHVSSSDNYDIGGTQNVYEVDYTYEHGKCVYSRRTNSMVGGSANSDVEENFYKYRSSSGETFGRTYDK